MDRRTFLHTLAGGAVGLGGAALFGGCAAPGSRTSLRPGELRISLAEWSLHRTLQKGEMSNLDFPARARSYGIGAVEFVNAFFKDKARDQAYLAELKQRCEDSGVRSLLIMCDGEGALGDADTGRRMQAVQNHYRWVEAARALGCHSIRVNAQSSGSYEETQKLAADGLSQLNAYGDRLGIGVIVENHGGYSSNGAWLAAVMERVGHPNCGTLPDFGNFRISGTEEYDRYQGVAELMPYAKAVSAKSHDFDASGAETRTDYKRMLGIVRDSGYSGFVGIEYEGGGLSEDQGILATKNLLEANLVRA